MQLIKHSEAPMFEADGTRVTGYAAPSRGASQTSVWQLELAPGSASPLHRLDGEEVFLAASGEAVAVVGDAEHVIGAGDCLIVPAGTSFTLGVRAAAPFRALVCLPCGAQAIVEPDGEPFLPPWAE